MSLTKYLKYKNKELTAQQLHRPSYTHFSDPQDGNELLPNKEREI